MLLKQSLFSCSLIVAGVFLWQSKSDVTPIKTHWGSLWPLNKSWSTHDDLHVQQDLAPGLSQPNHPTIIHFLHTRLSAFWNIPSSSHWGLCLSPPLIHPHLSICSADPLAVFSAVLKNLLYNKTQPLSPTFLTFLVSLGHSTHHLFSFYRTDAFLCLLSIFHHHLLLEEQLHGERKIIV